MQDTYIIETKKNHRREKNYRIKRTIQHTPISRWKFRKNHSSLDSINFGNRSIREKKRNKNKKKKTGRFKFLSRTPKSSKGDKNRKTKKRRLINRLVKWRINRDRSCSLRLLQSWNARGLGNYARGRNIRPDSRNFAGKLKGGRSMFTDERRAIVPSVRRTDEDWNGRSDERTHL